MTAAVVVAVVVVVFFDCPRCCFQSHRFRRHNNTHRTALPTLSLEVMVGYGQVRAGEDRVRLDHSKRVINNREGVM